MNRFKLFSILCILLVASFPCAIYGAKAKKTTTTPEQLLNQANEAFHNYEFEKASELLEQYQTLKKKAKQAPDEEYEMLDRQLEIAERAFDRVQKIVVIDSINMPRETFFKAYNLAQSAGKLGLPSDFKLKGVNTEGEVSFLNEDRDYLITAIPDQEGYLQLIENHKLLDGSWHSSDILEGEIEKTGDYNYPFLSGDGQTLYFANNGEESMGGYDLFVVQKAPITGEILQPLNLGMPFNSPYDDFMMAIDEENGVGWWATDRNSPGGDVTIYVYILDDIRKNYPSDTENLEEKARIINYKDTWEEGNEKTYGEILKKIGR